MKEKLIKNGVKNLKEFGYLEVTEENILTDMVYAQFFKNMLEENLGKYKPADKYIQELITQIETGSL